MKSRAEINRQNYLRNAEARREKARERKRRILASWREGIAEWDALNPWDSGAVILEATGLSQHSLEAAYRDPMDVIIEELGLFCVA